jgi:NitT/TauT family transport system substrate-binding protein
MTLSRRNVLKQTLAGSALTLAAPSLVRAAGSSDKIRVGYLHTLAVDGQIWLADMKGYWKQQGLTPTFHRFYTGLQLFQAMVGGSIDILSTGAVVSNFPARGQGKVFLANDVEFATAQLWVNPKEGVTTFADLKGKKIATSVGTTADVFLYTALQAHGLTPGKDVTIVNQTMNDAVTAFIAGAVPAVALWVPFNIQVEKHLPGAKMLETAAKYYPQAAIVDGWAARNDFYDKHKDILSRVIKAWIPANRDLIEDTDASLKLLHNKEYPDVSLDALHTQIKAEKLFTAEKWAKLYKDGTVTNWLQHVTDIYVHIGGMSNPLKAAQYFDPGLFLKAVS